MANVSYPELPQPMQAHEKDSVTSPNLPESVPESHPQVYETPTLSPQVHETPIFSRPQRDRKPPSRFMYYSAGEPFSCSNVSTNFPPSAMIPPKPSLALGTYSSSFLPNDVTSATTNVVLPLPTPTPIPNCLQNSYSSTDAIFVYNRIKCLYSSKSN